MSGFGAFLADWLGANPAEFDRWRFLWGRAPTGWLLAGAAVFLVVFLIFSWRAAKTIETPAKRGLLTGLRVVGAALLALLFFDPAVEFLKTQRREDRFAVFVDTSRSMSLKDTDGRTRMKAVRSHLESHGEQFQKLDARYRVDWFTFDEKPRMLDQAQREKELTPAGADTKIGESIDAYLSQASADPPGGIILYSDGADHGRIKTALKGGGALAGVPLYPVLLPNDTPPDAAVTGIITDPYAFIRNGFDVRAKIRKSGIETKGFDATLKIDGQIAAVQKVSFAEDENEAEVTFHVTPQRVGRYVYTVSIPTFTAETMTENNARNTIVKVVRDRIRVLQVVGEPSWDERFLRRYLEKDPNVDLISFMILRTREDLDATPESELSLIPFPTRELFTQELQSFDLVIFQNFDYRPYFDMFPGRLLENLRKFVQNDGGGFVMLGGDKSFTYGGYANTPIESILPVNLPGMGSHTEDDTGFRLTEEGKRHPVTGLDLPAAETTAAWEGLPKLAGVNVIGEPKPAAEVLLRHPSTHAPLLAVMNAGKGRSMALAADSSWLWNFAVARKGDTGTYYQRFWNNAIRWLVHDPEFGRVRLEADRDEYQAGEPVRMRCRVLDEAYKPAEGADVKLRYRRRGKSEAWQPLAGRRDEAGVHTAELNNASGGVYELECSARLDGADVGTDSLLVNVDPMARELFDTTVDHALLIELARRSGGEPIEYGAGSWPDAIGLSENGAFEVVGRQVSRLWDNGWVLVFLTIIFSTEWFLRRRWGGL